MLSHYNILLTWSMGTFITWYSHTIAFYYPPLGVADVSVWTMGTLIKWHSHTMTFCYLPFGVADVSVVASGALITWQKLYKNVPSAWA